MVRQLKTYIIIIRVMFVAVETTGQVTSLKATLTCASSPSLANIVHNTPARTLLTCGHINA
jgi:hypothetical protein